MSNFNIDKIILGEVNGKEVYWDIRDSLNSHVALIGGSGGGKSVQAQKIICEIVKMGGTVLILDMHGTFTEDQIFPAFKEIIDSNRHDIDVYKEGISCKLFEPVIFTDGSTELDSDTVGAITDVLCRTFKLGVNQRSALRHAIEYVMDYGTYKEDGFNAIGKALLRYEDKISNSLYERMLPLFQHNVLKDGENFILESKINVVHLGKLDLCTQEVVAEILLSHIWRLGNADQFKKKNLFLFLDEAQNYDSSSKGPLAMMISEGRRMGVNLILATQMILVNTSNAVQQRISQCGLILYFKPAISRIGQTAKMISAGNESQWIRILGNLGIGEFVATGNLLLMNRKISYPLKISAYLKDLPKEKNVVEPGSWRGTVCAPKR